MGEAEGFKQFKENYLKPKDYGQQFQVEIIKHGKAYFKQTCPECDFQHMEVTNHWGEVGRDASKGIYYLRCPSCRCEVVITV
jgi:hypothetical protein